MRRRHNMVAMLRLTILVSIMVFTAETANNGQDGPAENPRTGYACEGGTLNIHCMENKYISIIRANYGRFNIQICNDGGVTEGWDLQCMSTRALRMVEQICQHQTHCKLRADNRRFGDPCYLTPKYLEVQYRCVYLDSGSTPTTKTAPATTQPAPTQDGQGVMDSTPLPLSGEGTTPAPGESDDAEASVPPPERGPSPPSPPSLLETTVDGTPDTPVSVVSSTTTPPPTPPPSPPPRPEAVTHCEGVLMRGVQWPRTPAGAIVIKECPNNPEVRGAVWRCKADPVVWEDHPILSKCQSQQMVDLGQKLARAKEEVSSEIFEEVVMEIEETSRTPLYGGDVRGMMTLMRDAVGEVHEQVKVINKTQAKEFVDKVSNSVLRTSSNLLAEEMAPSWKDLPQATQSETATRLLSSVEGSAQQMVRAIEKPRTVVTVNVNIVLELSVVDTSTDHVADITFPRASSGTFGSPLMAGGGNSIRLPGAAIKDLGVEGLARLIFLTYNNLDQWLNPMSVGGASAEVWEDMAERPETVAEFRGTQEEIVYLDEAEMKLLAARNRPGSVRGSPDAAVEHFPRDQQVSAFDGGVDQGDGEGSETHPEPADHHQKPEDGKLLQDKADDKGGDQDQKKNFTTVVNSKIISASVITKPEETGGEEADKPMGHVHLEAPVIYTLEHQTKDNVYNPTCSFWEYSERTMTGRWSTFGCQIVDTNVTHTVCSCSHITNFAVLMDVSATPISEEHQFALEVITYIGCTLSIIALFLCFLTFQCFKNLQCDRNTIHKNLVLCLLLAELVFLAGLTQTQIPVLCALVAAALHYLFLAAFMWMLMEGIQLYVMLVEVFEAEKSRIKYYYLTSYGVPVVIVGISAAVDHQSYGTDNNCWLAVDTGFIWAFVGPVIAIIAVNVVMLSIAIYQMCKHAQTAATWKMKQKSKMENVGSWLKGAGVLVVLLGLTWTFGLLYINKHTVFMAYIFAILNSLQGLFIFLFHCLMNEKVEKEYKRGVRRATWLPQAVRVKYGGAKPTTSTSPNQSSSSAHYLTKLFSGRRRKRSSTSTMLPVSSNQSKWQYQNMEHTVAAGGQAGRHPGRLSDSGIGRNPSSMYSEGAEGSEDAAGYLEPVSARRPPHPDPLDDIDNYKDLSVMEGSCVDTDYYGVDGQRPPTTLNFDKYKIQPSPSCPARGGQGRGRPGPLPEAPEGEEGWAGQHYEEGGEGQVHHDYEEVDPVQVGLLDASRLSNDHQDDDYDTIERIKQGNRREEGLGVPAPTPAPAPTSVSALNNLNKAYNEGPTDTVQLTKPNIHQQGSPFARRGPSGQGSLPPPRATVALAEPTSPLRPDDDTRGLLDGRHDGYGGRDC
nr:adhesion G protein-coupled receptor, Latrophilin [Arenicola marina]